MPATGEGNGKPGLTRREFVWTMGAAAAAYGLQDLPDENGIFWSPEPKVELGWAPGLEEFRTSTCLICPSRCGIRGRLVDGRLVRVVGNQLHPLSRGGVCPRGIAGLQMVYHPERIAGPMVAEGARGGGNWRGVSRDEALTLLTERLRASRTVAGPESLALVAGYCAGSMQALWHQFLRSYGSPNYVADDYADGTDCVMGLMHGIRRRPAYDLEQASLVLSFGAPLFESWWSPLQAYVAFGGSDEDGGQRPRFIQVDARFSRTAARTQEWVGVKPGTHSVLALGIAYVLIRNDLHDADFLSRHVAGFEDAVDGAGATTEGYRSLVLRNYRTEEVSAVTGVPVERITALARAFGSSPAPVAVCGADVTQAPNGLQAGMAVHSLNLLLGRVNRPGGVIFGKDPPLAPLASPVLDDAARAGLTSQPVAGPGPAFGTGDVASRFARAVAAGDGRVENLLLYYADPLASSVHPEAWRAALARIPFVVSFSPYLDETTRQADLVLPDLVSFERWQDAPSPASYPYPVWGVAQPLVEPQVDGIATGDAVLAVASRLGGSVARSLAYPSFEELLKERAKGLFEIRRGMLFASEFEGRHHRQMEERGWWLREHDEFEEFWEDLVDRGGWTDLFHDFTDPAGIAQTPDGLIDLMPEELTRALVANGLDRTPYIGLTGDNAVPPADFPLRLMPYRVSTLASGTLSLERWLAEVPGLFPETLWYPWVEVHPDTVRTLGLEEDTMVWISSSRGRMRARLKVFPGTAPGNVCVPYRLQHPDGELANPLQLLDGPTDPLTGLAPWFTTFVRLDQVGAVD